MITILSVVFPDPISIGKKKIYRSLIGAVFCLQYCFHDLLQDETIVVLFADCIVSSILYLFEKDPKAQLDYGQLIDTVFKKKLETDELWENQISLAQLYEMKHHLLGSVYILFQDPFRFCRKMVFVADSGHIFPAVFSF